MNGEDFLFDDGIILGGLLIIYRVALAGWVVFASVRAWRRRSPEALVFAAAAFMLLLNGQWGQATTLGSAMIGGGLALAAANNMGSAKTKSARKVKSKFQDEPVNAPAK